MTRPEGSRIWITSPRLNRPSTEATPTGSRLANRLRSSSAEAAPSLTVTEPAAWPSALASQRLAGDASRRAGNRVPAGSPRDTLSRMSGSPPSAITTSVPRLAVLRAMASLLCMPPRPRAEVPRETSSSGWCCSSFQVSIQWVSGSSGSPSNTPGTVLSRHSRSAPTMPASKPASSSLSVNISSVIETTSFSLTTGTMPALSRLSIQPRMFR
ncbi:MAG: hypothetical protein PVJ33_09385 [Lysobacterales bacterium]|jgi:hypothetical protein